MPLPVEKKVGMRACLGPVARHAAAGRRVAHTPRSAPRSDKELVESREVAAGSALHSKGVRDGDDGCG